MKIAVVGAGVSGLVAARLLASAHDVTLFEADDRLGGHAHTHQIDVVGLTRGMSNGKAAKDEKKAVTIDTGFMVFNERTYPNFCRLLRELEVSAQDSDMSFSVRCDRTKLEYQGSSLNGLFAQRSNLVRPKFYRLLADVMRFNRDASDFVNNEKANGESTSGESADDLTLGEFLTKHRYSSAFANSYLKPMTAAIWSAKPKEVEAFPAKFLLGFYANHGLLQIRDRPQWRTIVGGSQKYVKAISDPFKDNIRLGTRIESIRRTEGIVEIKPQDSEAESYDRVVLACHADQSLRLLTDSDTDERALLEAFPYQMNDAIVHTDPSVMPRRERAWASWNYRTRTSNKKATEVDQADAPEDAPIDAPVEVTYYLNRLQNFTAPRPVFVTLNPAGPIAEEHVLKRLEYAHPCYKLDSIKAQETLPRMQGHRQTYYCGAYGGYGFHEDGVRSGLAVAKCFDLSFDNLFTGKFSSYRSSANQPAEVLA